MTPDGVFDVGNQTLRALRKIQAGVPDLERRRRVSVRTATVPDAGLAAGVVVSVGGHRYVDQPARRTRSMTLDRYGRGISCRGTTLCVS